MLRTLKPEEFEKYAEYAYSLALDMSRSSYPTYADGIKTREDFMSKAKRGISGDPNTEILLFESKGRVITRYDLIHIQRVVLDTA